MSNLFRYHDRFFKAVPNRGPNVHSFLFAWVLASCFCFGCQSFQKRISQRSAHCGALCAQAREAEERGNSDQANAYINEALRHKTNDFETRRQLAETLWNNGRQSEAVQELANLCAELPKDTSLGARLAAMQWESNQFAAAGRTADLVVQADPQCKEAWRIKARNEVATDQLEAALLSYMRLSHLAPDDLSTLIELGELHMKRGHPDRACPLFRAALEHPRSTITQRNQIEWLLGVAYARSERWSVAVSVLENAMARRSASADDWCFLGSARFECGDLTGARADLERALRRDPHCKSARILARQIEASMESKASGREIIPASHEQGVTIR